MELVDSLKDEYSHLCPIVILSPTQRCGATFMQRLFNAGGQSLIYGENFYLTEVLPRHIGDMLRHFDRKVNMTEKVFNRFMDGERGMEGTALFPDYRLYAEQVLMQFYQLLDFYHQESLRHGFTHWGIKYPIRDLEGAKRFLMLLPDAKLLVITRDLQDVARSLYARWPEALPNTRAFTQFGKRWAAHTDFLQTAPAEAFTIAYEQFVASPYDTLEQMEQYFEVRIDSRELSRRINIQDSDPRYTTQQHHRPEINGYYIPPAELPKDATKALLMGAGEVYFRRDFPHVAVKQEAREEREVERGTAEVSSAAVLAPEPMMQTSSRVASLSMPDMGERQGEAAVLQERPELPQMQEGGVDSRQQEAVPIPILAPELPEQASNQTENGVAEGEEGWDGGAMEHPAQVEPMAPFQIREGSQDDMVEDMPESPENAGAPGPMEGPLPSFLLRAPERRSGEKDDEGDVRQGSLGL